MKKTIIFLILKIVDSKILYGNVYKSIRWLSPSGQLEESWVPSSGFDVNANAYKVPVLDESGNDDSDLANSCNTSKEKLVRRQKIAGINIVNFPCGTIVDAAELYGSESLSQVVLPLYSLMKISSIQNDVKVLIHDNACRFSAFVKKRSKQNPIMEHISGLDMRLDRHHYKNHVGENCRANHDPDMCQLLQNVNTSIMEQVNAWFGRFRHSARYMNQARFSFYYSRSAFITNEA